jgi:hypothetical protein
VARSSVTAPTTLAWPVGVFLRALTGDSVIELPATTTEGRMAKGYWITFYRSISDPAALATSAKLAGPAITSNGGRFLARGGTVKTYEQPHPE